MMDMMASVTVITATISSDISAYLSWMYDGNMLLLMPPILPLIVLIVCLYACFYFVLYSQHEERRKLRVETQSVLKELKNNHEREIKTLSHEYCMEQMKFEVFLKAKEEERRLETDNEHRLMLEELRTNHRNEIRKMNDLLQNQIQEKGDYIYELVTSYKCTLETKESEYAHIIDDINKSHARKHSKLTEKITAVMTEKYHLEQELSRCVQELNDDKRIEMAILPYKLLADDLKSLKAILEMRNEELKQYRLKNMELQKELEHYSELRFKCESLVSENEFLKESLNERTLSERRLSVERDSLLVKFESELKRVDMLSLEREQLLWKVSNTDLISTNFPSVFVDTEDEDEGCSVSSFGSSGIFSSPTTSLKEEKLEVKDFDNVSMALRKNT